MESLTEKIELAPRVLPPLPARYPQQDFLDETHAEEAKRYIHTYKYNTKNYFKNLLKGGSDFDQIDILVKASPKYFLDAIWSWFTDVTNRIIDRENLRRNRYSEDYIDSLDFDNSEMATLSKILPI